MKIKEMRGCPFKVSRDIGWASAPASSALQLFSWPAIVAYAALAPSTLDASNLCCRPHRRR
jgi:hypothetical protein